MDNKEFKNLFGRIAQINGFERAFGGVFRESAECIIVLDLQKSNYGNYYQLMIKIYVQGMFGNKYSISKDLVKRSGGNIFRGESPQFKDIFNLDILMDDHKRKQRMEELFEEFILPFIDKALFRQGLRDLGARGEVYLLPAVKQELDMLD
ncbi:MAG TPA: DUF4304 domain-containing protein [Mucilaginibacter sp.]|jgi:hypothetical protein|nr:DUF4304 domain-containing protein [Mucilaginibacter sp.]